jgi:hypothetical protein
MAEVEVLTIWIEQQKHLADVDDFAKNLVHVMESILGKAIKEGAFKNASGDSLYQTLLRLQAWLKEYNNAGETKGMLRRLRDYFYAAAGNNSDNMDQLISLSQELGQACMSLRLRPTLPLACLADVRGSVQDLVERQSNLAKQVCEFLA